MFRQLLILTAFCAMAFSYGHSVQPDEPEVAQKSATECLASALNVSQLMEPQKRGKIKPPTMFLAQG